MRATPQPSDAELALRAQAGDGDAANQLVTRYRLQVFDQTWRLRLPAGVEFDDVASVGLYTLWRCVMAWSPSGGANFRTYAWTAVKRSIFRAVGEQKEKLDRQPVQVDEDGDDTLDLVPAREPVELPAGVSEWVNELSVVERIVVERTFGLDGTPDEPSKIGKLVGLSIHQVKTARSRAMATLGL
ncbi:sigma-70 family RNA polymerase sigma factor [Gemmata sp. G18]|uniref:Sigma-70 family RNA polymerase sigma factor n=1 Tax=Gemmata palustris TaxID=2822762 RepID=A0ABS5BMK2_9BACT|nr:sigma-70 family RNA polymerase sigma factor [Gemmata palustris]MBP3954954.1 sigma-70 family RNA polymerase sigma factor [Gemmata palustris]